MGELTEFLLSLKEPHEILKERGLPVYLYGTGDGADKISAYLEEKGVKIRGVFASDGFVRDREYRGYRVRSLGEVEKEEGVIAAVQCFGLEPDECGAVAEKLKNHLWIAPAVSVYGSTRIDRAFVRAHSDEIERVYAKLSDELSKALYRAVLAYSVSGEPAFLLTGDAKAEETPPRAYYERRGVHLDVGAFDGDTALETLENNPSVEKILAFEPDENTFRKLCRRTAGLPVEPMRCAVSDKAGSGAFSGDKGRGSHLESGAGEVPVVTLDGVCGFPFVSSDGMNVCSIKIDAEGQDKEVLRGGANLITSRAPAICVSAYHRAEDLTELPLLLELLNYRSELFFRKKRCVPAWDTVFYLIPKRLP